VDYPDVSPDVVEHEVACDGEDADGASDYEGLPEGDGDDEGGCDAVQYVVDYMEDDHQCTLECDCYSQENVAKDGYGELDFMSWGECDVTESGKEILRFMSTVMKGKSMSNNKAEDFLRCVDSMFVSYCSCCRVCVFSLP
jgi:hypothetical protein